MFVEDKVALLLPRDIFFSNNSRTYSFFFSLDGYDSTDIDYQWWMSYREDFLNVMIYSRDMQNYDVTEVVKSKNRTIYNHGKLRLSCFVSHCTRPFCGVGAERIKGTWNAKSTDK